MSLSWGKWDGDLHLCVIIAVEGKFRHIACLSEDISGRIQKMCSGKRKQVA